MTWEARLKARQQLEKETGAIVKDWGGRVPVALVYPNTYHIGMSNLGFQTVYALFNQDDAIVCERAFWDHQPLDGSGEPVVSLETQRELSEFAVIAFSLTFELDYFNILAILRQARIPLLATERDNRHPLVIAGGPCAMQNPEPLAPFFDAFAVGEGEVLVPRIVEALKQAISDRHDLLTKLAEIPGIYVPSLYDVDYAPHGAITQIVPNAQSPLHRLPVVRQFLHDLAEYPAHSVVLTTDTELGDMYLIEISRGCARGCQFCLAGFIFLPKRERPLEQIMSVAEIGLRHRKRIGLVSAATSDYSQIKELARRLRDMGAQIAVSSLRIDSLSDDLVKALVEGGTKTVTLAPEAGSERLRQLIGKRFTEEQILTAADLLGRWKVSKVKLYYMIGLPTETNDDIDEIIRLTTNIKAIVHKSSPGSQIAINASNFVPKAQTPFQYETMLSVAELKHRLNYLKRSLSRFGITVKSDSPEWAEVQGVLARGDRRLAKALISMRQTTLGEWRRALRDAGLSADFYIRRPREGSEVTPWEIVRSGVRPTLPSRAFRAKHSRASTGRYMGAEQACGS